MATAKMMFLLGYSMKIDIHWGEVTFGGRGERTKIWWREPSGGQCFQVGQNEQIFDQQVDSPYPPVAKTLDSSVISTPPEIVVGTQFHAEHGTKITLVLLPADGEAPWSLVQPEKSY